MAGDGRKAGEPDVTRHDVPVRIVWLTAGWLALLFGAGFAIRWLFADGDFFGDEAWYFYLARTFGLEEGAASDRPWFHLLNRPLYYAVFHASAKAGLLSFRLFATAIGALCPVLVFTAARALGASFGSAALGSVLICLHRQHIEHAAHAFPDLLAACLALASLWAAARGRAVATFALAFGCVLSKESFIAVPFIATLLRLAAGSSRPRRADAWAWATVGLPLGYVVGVTLLGRFIPGILAQGWAPAPFTLKHARNMGVGPELWPCLAWLAFARRGQTLALWLGLPAFYLVWHLASGRGLAPWYVIGPAAFSAVAAALALDALNGAVRNRPARYRWALGIALLACLLPVPLAGAARALEGLKQLDGRWPQPSAAPEVAAILAQRQPRSALIVNCFWAFAYSHLRPGSTPSNRIQWNDVPDVARIAERARAVELTIVCREPSQQAREDALAASGFETVFRDERWWLLRPTVPAGAANP